MTSTRMSGLQLDSGNNNKIGERREEFGLG